MLSGQGRIGVGLGALAAGAAHLPRAETLPRLFVLLRRRVTHRLPERVARRQSGEFHHFLFFFFLFVAIFASCCVGR